MWTIIAGFLLIGKIGAFENIISPQPEQDLHISYYGFPCAGECKGSGSDYFQCEIIASYYKDLNNYCSKQPNTDYMGRSCRTDHPCGFYEKEYTWCYVDTDNNWGYCGLILQESSDCHLSENGHTCQSLCVSRLSRTESECYVYAGVSTEGQLDFVWDSCSKQNQTTRTGVECRVGRSCDFHGYNYQWCYVGDNGDDWDYCGRVYSEEEKSAVYFTRYDEPCDSFCFDNGIGYSWCFTSNDTNLYDYCSVKQDVTYRGTPCHKYDFCGKHGYNHYWCYTEDMSWDYCSPVQQKDLIVQPVLMDNREMYEHILL